MDHKGFIIRPPSEADSILLQVTLGCSHNKCAFCGAYQGKPFRVKDQNQIMADIDWAAAHLPRHRRLFLMDGDATVLPMRRLEPILTAIRDRLPQVRRIASYASARSLATKTDTELTQLKALGLDIIYMGLESGDNALLQRMNKGVSVAEQLTQASRAKAAGLKLNVTVLLGLAGPEGSTRHAEATGAALSTLDPEQAAALSLMLVPGTPLHDDWQADRFTQCTAHELLAELRTLVAHTNLSRGLFLCNHGSNHLPFRARFPKEKDAVLQSIDAALAGETELKPEWQRRL
ncbi:B12-binding domain-containing radical SAM protein [Oceanidesulfovibrio marinus]|uniref:Radical SAM protein n=1 Tax=Oceanidesulfovibrio marinus TaxID=370038 RepID=A0ABX6NEK9_9BACT|nr:radical SAM protein [Oceanidesulfovibrio marinus]QJT09044.1 radical SAM protein [Oceanidesulfovibrio marinus]